MNRKLSAAFFASIFFIWGWANAEIGLDGGHDGPMKRFPLTRGVLVLERPAQPWSHIEALGEQAGIWGRVGGEVEAWVYPFKLFHGFTLSFSDDGGKTFRPSADLVRYQWATPHMTQLRLVADRFAVTQTLFVPASSPEQPSSSTSRQRQTWRLRFAFVLPWRRC